VTARFSLLALAMAALAGCADGSGTSCRVGADCASGVCMSDGTCARPRSDAGATDAASTPADDAFAPASDTGPVPDSGARICRPDGDGAITREESPLRAGLYATFRIAQSASVSTAGVSVAGQRRWDFSGALSGESDERVELLSPTGAWWGSEFPLASYAARLSASSDNLGVFQIRDDALLLLGLVSPADGVTRTLLTNDPPVEVLRFPLRMGDTWTTRATVTGQALGVVAAYTEAYTFVADASGVVVTPFGEVDVIRVRSELDRTQLGVPLDSPPRFAFLSEFPGPVATVTSTSFEADTEFTMAAELRRLAP